MEQGIILSTLQSCFLAALSNIVAQLIKSYQSKTYLNGTEFKLNFTKVAIFVIYTATCTPINYVWQVWLEKWFPGTSDGSSKRVQHKRKAERKFGNILAKFVLDQTIGAVFNTFYFLICVGCLEGKSIQQIHGSIVKESSSIIIAGTKIWPIVSLINYLLIPVHGRVVFSNMIGVFWNIFLSFRT